MTDDIRAEARRLWDKWGEEGGDRESCIADLAAALCRQLAEGFMLGWEYADKEGAQYQRGLEEGAREEREAIAQYVAEEWPRRQTKELKHRPPLNLNDGHDHYRWIAASIRARGEKP